VPEPEPEPFDDELEEGEFLESEPPPPPEPEPIDLERTYWAMYPIEEIAEAVNERIREYYETMSRTGLSALFKSAHAAFYSLSDDGVHEGSRIIESGDQGELLQVKSNQLRSIALYILTMATADRPAYQPKATNGSASAMAQVPTARVLLEYYHTRKGLERNLIGAALRALVYGKGYLWESWDPTLAKGQGDVVLKALSPLEVVCDPDRGPGEHDWFIIRTYRNKYDLAAQYGTGEDPKVLELRDDLLAMDGSEGMDSELQLRPRLGLGRNTREATDVAVWHMLHAPTQACPEGRYVIVTGKDICLFEGPLPFDELPVYEMCPEEFLEAGSLGYASIWDLLGLQRAFDGMNSTALSNFDAFGTNDLLLQEGTEISLEEVHGGLNAIRYPIGSNPPAVLEKFQLSDSFFKLREAFMQDMQLASGVNSTVRGDPQANLKSGTALALIQAQAVQFQSRFQGGYVRLTEAAATGLLRILKRYAQTERLAQISGAYDTDGLRSFKSDDISDIDRVEVESGSPIFRTVAGKFDVATQLLERGLIDDIDQYYQVLETGRLEPVTDPHRRAHLRVQEENEILMRGPQVIPKMDKATGQPQVDLTGQPVQTVQDLPALVTDHPENHVRAHACVLDSQDSRMNPQVVNAVVTHILEHLKVWREAPPDLLMLLKFPMPPPPPGSEEAEAPGTPGPEEKPTPQDPNRAKNEEKSKAAGNNAPGTDRPAKLPRPAQPPPPAA